MLEQICSKLCDERGQTSLAGNALNHAYITIATVSNMNLHINLYQKLCRICDTKLLLWLCVSVNYAAYLEP